MTTQAEKTSKESEHKPAPNPWDTDWHTPPSGSNIDKILDIPSTEDMAGVLARANFKDNRQRIAAVRLAHRNRMYKDTDHQNMLRDFYSTSQKRSYKIEKLRNHFFNSIFSKKNTCVIKYNIIIGV